MSKHDAVKMAVIIPAAGQSRRMGGINKLFLDIAGRPVLLRTVEIFLALGKQTEIVVATSYCDLSRARGLLEDIPHVRVVAGGDCRQQSVAKALAYVGDDVDCVLIHDGARPLLRCDELLAFVECGLQEEALIMAVPVKDTVKRVGEKGTVLETPCRDELWLAQTPQMFQRSVLCKVHAEACARGFIGTDEASLLERQGYAVKIFKGSYENMKITTPEDINVARTVLERRAAERHAVDLPGCSEEVQVPPAAVAAMASVSAMAGRKGNAPRVRVGCGYDMHALAEGRELILGGVRIPHERGLLGHSDADVLSHSIMDAMLGALALGDIGMVFPDSDAQYKDICSLTLLKKVMFMVRERGYGVCNIDAVICAQKPRLAAYRESMRSCLAACLDLETDQVSVKATTTEHLGPEGREEGISAQAVVVLERWGD